MLDEHEIKDMLKQQLTGPNKTLLADAMLGLIKDEWKLERLFKTLLGVKPVKKFPVGTKVKIPIQNISNYSWDKEKMRTEKLIIDEYIEVLILDYTPWEYEVYQIETTIIKDGKDIRETSKTSTTGRGMMLAEEWPEKKHKPEEDLPF